MTTVKDIIQASTVEIVKSFGVSLNAAEAAKVYLLALAHYGHGIQAAEAAANQYINSTEDYDGFGHILGAIYSKK